MMTGVGVGSYSELVRRVNYSRIIPPQVLSHIQRPGLQPNLSRPVYDTQRFAIHCKHHVVALVSVLSFPVSPPAVRRLIVSVAVDPIKRKPGRDFTHVREEVNKASPTLANPYPAATIVRILPSIYALASMNHRAPGSVRPCSPFPVLYGASLDHFAIETSTRPRVPASQIRRFGDNLIATVTPAHKERLAGWSLVGKSDYDQPTVSLSCQINYTFGHNALTVSQLLSKRNRFYEAPLI